MFKSQSVQPTSYLVENMGETVQALTFSYRGVVHTINRKGKRNIIGYLSNAQKTYSLTNGSDKFLRMSLYGIEFLSYVDTDGQTHVNFAGL